MLESKILEVRQRWCEKAVVLQTIIAEEKVFWNRNPKCDPVDRWGKRAKIFYKRENAHRGGKKIQGRRKQFDEFGSLKGN